MSDVDDSQNDEERWSRPSSADAIDLLELVRGAEEGARVATSTPNIVAAVPVQPAEPVEPDGEADGTKAEEFVDVGDEAVYLPPSLPPMRAAEPVVATTTTGRPPRARSWHPRPIETDVGKPMKPALAIVLVVAATIAALYGLLELPSLL